MSEISADDRQKRQPGTVPAGRQRVRLKPLGQRTSLAEDAYQALKTMLMNARPEPGMRLQINDLAAQLRVSSTPIRDALTRLQTEGLVRHSHPRGFQVAPNLTATQVMELFQFRELLEPWAAAQAADRATGSEVEALTAELHTVSDEMPGNDYQAYRRLLEHDQRFHDTLLGMAGNELIRQSLARSHGHLHLFRYRYEATSWHGTVAEHGEIVAAIAAGDAPGADAAMRTHLERASKRFGGVEAGIEQVGQSGAEVQAGE